MAGIYRGTLRSDQRLQHYVRPGCRAAVFVVHADHLPTSLPADGAPLLDWYEFESIVLPMQQNAHRFTVLLPAPSYITEDERPRRRDIAQRVSEWEKPAHATFDMKFFWALVRVGEARLGEDTLIDLGSRAPDLMPPFVLGRDYLSEGYLAPGHPQNVANRTVLDRDRLK